MLAKLEDRHPDGVDAERTVMQALAHTADQLKIHVLADNTALPVARRYLLNGLHIPPTGAFPLSKSAGCCGLGILPAPGSSRILVEARLSYTVALPL